MTLIKMDRSLIAEAILSDAAEHCSRQATVFWERKEDNGREGMAYSSAAEILDSLLQLVQVLMYDSDSGRKVLIQTALQLSQQDQRKIKKTRDLQKPLLR